MSILDPGEKIAVPDRYRFDFRIVDKTTGETVESDFTYLTSIDALGGCESVELHLYSLLRAFRRDLIEAERKSKAEAA